MIPRSQVALLCAIAVAGLLAACASRIDDYFALIISNIGINIILAVSLNLINGYTGQFSLGHAGFMAVGAYSAAAITMFGAPKLAPALTQGVGIHALFPIALVGGGLAAALAGVLVGAPSLRLKGDYLAIVTLGFGEIIRVLFRNVDSLGGALGLNGIPAYTNLFWVYAFAALTVYVVVSLVNSTYGRGFLAVHDDEIAAEAMGINTTRYKITAFVVGAFFAGVAGGLYGHSILTIAPTGFDFMRSIEIVVMVILGGMGNTTGVIIAAVLLTLLPEALRMISGVRVELPFAAPFNNFKWIADTRMIIYSLLVIVLMLARPQGLFTWGKRSGEKPKI
ncbi:MAG: branched-chain amino acid ABC transporter permease [Verrucomicrobia bacterium]|nr:branched-chain amino acid ABC transporter permease [Verrucomicrobiota bacterium]